MVIYCDIKIGSTGDKVKRLQDKIKSLGFYRAYVVDGKYGPKTVEAVKGVQGVRGLVRDGYAGPITCKAINLQCNPAPTPTPTPTPTPIPTSVKVLDLEFVKQPDIVTCGCVTGNRMLKSLGISSTIERLRTLMKTQPITAGSPGTTPDNFKAGLIAAAGEQGKTLNFTAKAALTLTEIKSYIDQGIALGLHGGTIPCMDYENYYGHYIGVIGYNLDKSEVYIHDSSRGKKWVPWTCLQAFIIRRNAVNPWKLARM